ncbi:HXXXD-type acyl-transferase family protein [Prunus dulcis]|uniref:HXXXD-type acyl-transferase family protein n=1 Tax=Prunus dulcis TaxID=3755 RepID=A0A4Y1RBD4_PRUDU|nr:HXXXD-type acyl-transferase family protein [Prunus dulcis]
MNIPPTITEISKHLKKSLSEVLTLFYPLAGRLRVENHFVDCNDKGIPYLEGQVKPNCQLCDFLNDPVPDDLQKFVPFEAHDHNEFSLGVQLNMFECGGFAIGLSVSHKLADGLSMLMLTKTWAAISRGEYDNLEAKIEHPEFVSATLFPPKEMTRYYSHAGITKNKVTKRFVFDSSAIEDLREKYTSLENNEKRPSRVETLSAFIWRRFVEATKGDPDQNIDDKNNSGDNDYDDEDEESCHGMVRRVREEISKIDKDYVKRLQQGDEHFKFMNRLALTSIRSGGKVVTSYFSSLCRFPLYDMDFGWGRPAWVGIQPLPLNNLIVFVDTKETGGIEAYVTLADLHVMAKFESDPFLQRRVHTGRFDTAVSSLAHQPARFNQVAKFHSQDRSSVN